MSLVSFHHGPHTDSFSFGWVNASYIVGLQVLDQSMRRRLGALASWDEYKEKKTPEHRASGSHVPPLANVIKGLDGAMEGDWREQAVFA